MPTSTTAACQGKMATLRTSNSEYTMALAGMQANAVSPMPMTPAVKPTMMVSALNTRLMSPLLAPMERRMPISFLRSSTLI